MSDDSAGKEVPRPVLSALRARSGAMTHPETGSVSNVNVMRSVLMTPRGVVGPTLPKITCRPTESYLDQLNRGDADLAARIAAGDQGVLEELFRQFAGCCQVGGVSRYQRRDTG